MRPSRDVGTHGLTGRVLERNSFEFGSFTKCVLFVIGESQRHSHGFNGIKVIPTNAGHFSHLTSNYAVMALTAVTRSLRVRTSKTALHQTANWLISESLSSHSSRGSGLSQNRRLARAASVAKSSKPAAR